MRLRPKGLRSLRFGEAAFLFDNSFKTTGCRVFQHPAKERSGIGVEISNVTLAACPLSLPSSLVTAKQTR